MKFRNNLKRFFTLDRHHAEGFTLVELIVVIAILAILAGVGVPAYSGYITKTNKQADITLVSDIQYAMTLAGYNGTFAEGEGGVMVLSADGIKTIDEQGKQVAIAEDSALATALKATFGSNYNDTLKLKYDSWPNNYLAAALAGGMADSVYDSTYYAGSDKLMDQVADLTNAAYQLLNYDNNSKETIIGMFGEETVKSAAATYGYSSVDAIPNSAMPNLMVLMVANGVAGGETGGPAGIVQKFAKFNAYAATAEGQKDGFAAAYDQFVQDISGKNTDISTVANAFKTLESKTAGTGYDAYAATPQCTTDSNAFVAMMRGLTVAARSDSKNVGANLDQANFFTEGMGNELFNSYISAVEVAVCLDDNAMNALAALATSGEPVVGVYYAFNNNKVSVGNTLPAA